jgi:hypothetical protein
MPQPIPIRTRIMDIHAPIVCVVCKKEIVKGERYFSRRAQEAHVGCKIEAKGATHERLTH